MLCKNIFRIPTQNNTKIFIKIPINQDVDISLKYKKSSKIFFVTEKIEWAWIDPPISLLGGNIDPIK